MRSDDPERRRPLEVHERWHYTPTGPRGPVQALRRLICLCRFSHETTHFGLAQVRRRDALALAHLTDMTPAQADRHVAAAFALWRDRNQRRWTLDLSMLTDAGVTLAPPPEAADRPELADRELHRRRS